MATQPEEKQRVEGATVVTAELLFSRVTNY